MNDREPSALGTALVTGASAGIGKVYAERLARQGYDLHLVARRGDKLKEIAQPLTKTYGVRVQTTVADLADPKAVLDLQKAVGSDSTLTMLVNNAGVSLMKPIVESDPAEVSAIVALNVVATTCLTIAALKGFKARNRGTIVNLGSMVGFGIFPGVAIYSSTKAFLMQFTRALQAELQGTNVIAQLVTPAAVTSEGFDRAMEGALAGLDSAWIMTTEDCVDAALQGLGNGEAITAPSLEDAGLITAYLDAGTNVLFSSTTGTPASRYGLSDNPRSEPSA